MGQIDPNTIVLIIGTPHPEISEVARRLREITREHDIQVILPRAPEVPDFPPLTVEVAQRLHTEVERLRRKGNVHDSRKRSKQGRKDD